MLLSRSLCAVQQRPTFTNNNNRATTTAEYKQQSNTATEQQQQRWVISLSNETVACCFVQFLFSYMKLQSYYYCYWLAFVRWLQINIRELQQHGAWGLGHQRHAHQAHQAVARRTNLRNQQQLHIQYSATPSTIFHSTFAFWFGSARAFSILRAQKKLL